MHTLTRKCPFSSCVALVPAEKFGCARHWAALTKEQQATIWEAYSNYREARITLSELRSIQAKVLMDYQASQKQPGTKCRTCGDPIVFRHTVETNSLMPVNADTNAFGTIRMVGQDKCEVLTALEAAAAREGGELLHLSHFATCKNAKQHRRKK